MKASHLLRSGTAVLLLGAAAGSMNLLSAQESPPNIVVILTDDQGYGDISFNPHHPEEVHTPHMDSLAREGVFFSQAYITGNVCSPTRAGLMTGRYQQRAGIYTAGEGGSGLPLDLTIFPQYLKSKGYVSGAFGKWHLGLTPEYNPVSRGFDEFYGFMGRGAHDYYDLDNPESPLYRGLETIKDTGYLTNLLTEEATRFIRSHKEEPFFCYLAYNAVHTPAQAPSEDIADFDTGDETRNILMAMLRHLDNGVGEVVNTLKEEGVWDNTLLFFLTDNGGAGAMNADCSPLRGRKQFNWEGGISTPFIMSWPDRFSGGRIIETPVISLDILPTVLDAANIAEPAEQPLDGKSILPVITEGKEDHHEYMFWSEGGETGEWAVRYRDWKLVVTKDEFHLADLAADRSETTNLINTYPDTADHMIAKYLEWLDEMAEPMQLADKSWMPKIQQGQLASLYDRLYFRGNVRHFDEPGKYNKDALSAIGDNQTRSLMVAEGYSLKAYSEDTQTGIEQVFENRVPYVNGPGDGISSFILIPDNVVNVEVVKTTASTAEETADAVFDKDFSTYWEAKGAGEWIQFEFAYKVILDGIRISFKRGDRRKAFFNVEVSEDGSIWNTVIEDGESSGSSTDYERFTFPPSEAKYLRIVGMENSDNRQNHYTEVDFSFVDIALDGYVIEAEDYSSLSGMQEIFVDDFAGFMGISNSSATGEASYEVNDIPKGNYLVKMRAKPKNTGTLDILVNDEFRGSVEIKDGGTGEQWTDLEQTALLPAGDKEFTISITSDGEGNDVEINWFQFLSIPVGYQEERGDRLSLYPNPCKDHLFIQSEHPVHKIEVFNQTGRRVMTTHEPETPARIPVSSLPPGYYLSRITLGLHTGYLKFLKLD